MSKTVDKVNKSPPETDGIMAVFKNTAKKKSSCNRHKNIEFRIEYTRRGSESGKGLFMFTKPVPDIMNITNSSRDKLGEAIKAFMGVTELLGDCIVEVISEDKGVFK